MLSRVAATKDREQGADAFAPVFQRLRAILTPYADRLRVGSAGPQAYFLNAPRSAGKPEGVLFGGVQSGKRYVSFHLMPVYVHPDLLDGMSDELRRRMQGKSCFNFRKIEEPVLEELERLTARSFERYRAEGAVQ